MRIVALVLCMSMTTALAADTHARANGFPVRVHHPITTTSAAAQAAFDEGLLLIYSYARLPARRSFERAAKADPKSAMAYWGIALSRGSNINVEVDPASERAASTALQRAEMLSSGASVDERAYIAALSKRYSADSKTKLTDLAKAYNAAMAQLVKAFPDDLDAATLYAESGMELHPWQLYSVSGRPAVGTQTIVDTLESVLRRDPGHVGANHYYLHAVEASLTPERALPSAERLNKMDFEPAAAHLVHMPAHIVMRTGFYDAAVRSNEHATAHDTAYLSTNSKTDPEASGYYDHNLAFLNSAYSMEGNYAGAIAAARRMERQNAVVPELFTLARFQQWHDLIMYPKPKPDKNEPLRIAIWHYCRGMAHAAMREHQLAAGELEAVRAQNVRLKVEPLPGNYNGSNSILRLAEHVLSAKIAQSRGDQTSSEGLLAQAVRDQDALLYIEPPDWYFPVREALGTSLFKKRKFVEAAAVFRNDLRRNPRNPRSLYGLLQSIDAQSLGSDRQWVVHELQAATAHSDVPMQMPSL